MTCRPGHPPRHPPFEPGNRLAVVHGAESPALVAERAELVHAELKEAAPWVTDLDGEAVARYCQAEARSRMLHDHIEKTVTAKGVTGVPSRTWEQATAASRLAATLGGLLGLDPMSRARLQRDASQAGRNMADLEALAEQGRAARARRLLPGAPTPAEPTP